MWCSDLLQHVHLSWFPLNPFDCGTTMQLPEPGGLGAACEGWLATACTTIAGRSHTLLPPCSCRSKQWPKLMDEFSKLSCADYRGIVFQHPDFISYFRQVQSPLCMVVLGDVLSACFPLSWSDSNLALLRPAWGPIPEAMQWSALLAAHMQMGL